MGRRSHPKAYPTSPTTSSEAALGADYGLRYDERDWRVLIIDQIERARQVLEDAAPERLIGYGTVSPDAREDLGGAVADLQVALRDMQALVRELRPAAG